MMSLLSGRMNNDFSTVRYTTKSPVTNSCISCISVLYYLLFCNEIFLWCSFLCCLLSVYCHVIVASPAFTVLEGVVRDKALGQDLVHLMGFLHTGNLEVREIQLCSISKCL